MEEKGTKQMPQIRSPDVVDECSSIATSPSSSRRSKDMRDPGSPRSPEASKKVKKCFEDHCGVRERLKRYRAEMAGRVCIPESWGQESSLKDWAGRYAFESSVLDGLASARKALADDCRRASSCRLQIENRC